VTSRYTPLRHAHIGETRVGGDRLLPIEWVMLARWDFGPKGTEYCVEFLDAATEIAGEDAHFPTEEEAEQHAMSEFGLSVAEWRDGPPPLPH
jgi:hypothetical protein